jgi:hypothetical protein
VNLCFEIYASIIAVYFISQSFCIVQSLKWFIKIASHRCDTKLNLRRICLILFRNLIFFALKPSACPALAFNGRTAGFAVVLGDTYKKYRDTF